MSRYETDASPTPLVFHVRLRVKPDCTDEWLQAVHDIIEAMSKEDTFLSCDLHRDANEPTLSTLSERWSEPSGWVVRPRQDKPYRREYEAKLPGLLQGPREPQVLVPLGSWSRTT